MRQLEELQSTLQQYAKECKERVTDITAGSLYVVLAEDNVWYRGIVMGAPEGSSKVSIMAVDILVLPAT